MLVLVLGLLMVSYASSMRAFLEQRHHLAALRSSIASSQAQVDRLSQERKRFADPAYVQMTAHQRFGWVMPGEIGFQVLGEDGKPLGRTAALPDPASVAATRPLWWQSAWGSVVTAGRPVVDPSTAPRPARSIKAPPGGGTQP